MSKLNPLAGNDQVSRPRSPVTFKHPMGAEEVFIRPEEVAAVGPGWWGDYEIPYTKVWLRGGGELAVDGGSAQVARRLGLRS